MPNGDAKRDAILSAAMEVFASYGLKKTTVGDIIRAAGVSRATVYKHFADKGEIFDAVVEREIREMLAADRRAVSDETSTEGRLRAAVATHAELIRKKINLLRVTKERFGEIVPHTKARTQKMRAEATELFADIIRQGVEEGDIVVDDVEQAAVTMLYAVQGIFMGAVMDVWDADRDELIDRMVELLMNGLRPREERYS